jgi:hypothetical protein
MCQNAKSICLFVLWLAVIVRPIAQGVAAESPGGAATAPSSEPSDDIDPAQLSPIAAQVPQDYVAHQDADGAFTIRTPPSWTAAPHRKPVAILLKSERPEQSVNVVVVASPAAGGLKGAMASLPGTIAKQFPGFKLMKSDYVLFCGRPSGRLQYEVRGVNGKTVRIMQIFLMRGGKAYVVTFTAPADEYEDGYKRAEPVIASFELTADRPASQPG